jgi:hypothetical protein
LRLVETIYRSVIDGDWWLESGCDILVWNWENIATIHEKLPIVNKDRWIDHGFHRSEQTNFDRESSEWWTLSFWKEKQSFSSWNGSLESPKAGREAIKGWKPNPEEFRHAILPKISFDMKTPSFLYGSMRFLWRFTPAHHCLVHYLAYLTQVC